jgi:NADH dehydrogenase
MITLARLRQRLHAMASHAPVPGRRTVVVGAGFGGVYAALYLDQDLHDEDGVEVFLISDANFLLFNPLAVEVATGGIEPSHIAQPIRDLTKQRQFRFIQATVQRIDLDERLVVTDAGEFSYDYLVIALGSITSFLDTPGAAEYAFPLKTLRDAVALREHVITQFELAARTPDAAARRALLTFVVAGGGPSGVEYIAELADLVYGTLLHQYSELSADEVRLMLVQSPPRLLPAIPEKLAQLALRELKTRGIDVRLETRLAAAGPSWVRLGVDETIPAHTLVWTAGVQANAVVAALPVEHGPHGRLRVEATLALPGHPRVYAVGDAAYFLDTRTGKPLPMLAQVAARQGARAAANIVAQLQGHPPEAFEFHYLGNLTSLGSRSAVADIMGLHLHGRLASLIWRLVYVSKLIGFRNKVRVGVDWIVSRFFGRDSSLLEPARRTGARVYVDQTDPLTPTRGPAEKGE